MTGRGRESRGSWFGINDRRVVQAAVHAPETLRQRVHGTAPADARRLRQPGRIGVVLRSVAAAAAGSPRARRVASVMTIAMVVLVGMTCSIGVIMLDNVVIHRSAELGKLDQDRKRLRTENALLAADIAKLSAPPRVVQRARRKLGMTEGPMPTFIFLDPSNRPVNTRRRVRVARARSVKLPVVTSTVPVPAATSTGTRNATPAATRSNGAGQ